MFVVNHDKERDGEALNANAPSNIYILAHIFSLAYPYGRVSVLSSYEGGLGDKDVGGPNQGKFGRPSLLYSIHGVVGLLIMRMILCLGNAKCSGSARNGNGGWMCQHRWVAIAGMTRFRNAVQDAPLDSLQSPRDDRIAFSRGMQFLQVPLSSVLEELRRECMDADLRRISLVRQIWLRCDQ